MQFWIRDAVNGEYYFSILAANNRVLAHSETYHNKSDCRSAVELVRRNAASAVVYDVTKSRT